MAGPAAALGIDVVANITEAQAALAKVQAQLEATAATSESAAAKSAAAWTAAGKKMQTVGKSMTKYITVPAVAAGAVAVKLAMDFDKSMALIQTQAGASASEVKKLSQEVLDFAKSGKTQFSPNDLAQALYSIESAGIHGAKAMDTLKASAKLATVGQADLAETTKALAAAQKTGIKGSADLKKAIGTLNATVGAGQMHMDDLVAALGTGFLSTAKTAGLSLTDVGTALDELTKQGMPAAAAATRLRMTMSLIAAPSTAAAAALKGIGLSSTDMANAMRGKGNIIDALQLLQDHLDGLSHTQIQQVLTAAFGGGRSSGAILSMLGNLDDMKKTMGDITANTDKVGESFRKMQEEPSVQLERVWSQMQAILIDMGNKLIPKLIPLVQKVAGVLETVITAFSDAPKVVQDFLIGAVVLGPFISALGKVAKMVGFIAKSWEAVRAAAAGAAVAEGAASAVGGVGAAGGAVAAGGAAEAAGGIGLGAAAATALPVAAIAAPIVALSMRHDSVLNPPSDKEQIAYETAVANAVKANNRLQGSITSVQKAQDARTKAQHANAAAYAEVQKAEDQLRTAVAEYGPTSRQAKRAEDNLSAARHQHKRTADEATTAEKNLGIAQAGRRGAALSSGFSNAQLIGQLKAQIDGDKALIKYDNQVGAGRVKLSQDTTILKAHQKQLADAQDALKKSNDTLSRAQNKNIGTTKNQAKAAVPLSQRMFQLQNPFQQATGATNDFSRAQTNAIGPIHKFTGTIDSIKNWAKDTVHAFASASKASADGTNAIKNNANSALKGLGVGKSIDFSTFTLQGTPGAHQKGGRIVPGKGAGDTVPAMLEPGEFVLNREAVKGIGAARLEAMNKAIPRFAKGGQVPAMTAMINEANKFEAHHFPYAWGGGHSGFGIQPVDCSGFVSDVLHAGGLLNTPMVSGSLMNWGKPGKGPLTVYANPEHTFMSLNGRFAGTSSSNPGGGAGWVEGGYPAGYLAGFAARTMAAAGGVMGAVAQKIKRQIIRGPRGALGAADQMGLDHAWNAANAYIAKHAPSGKFGGGQAMADLGTKGWHKTGATYEGLDGQMGKYGVVGGMGFAELLLAGANAGMHPNLEDIIGKRVPGMGKVGFRYGNKQAIAVKNDIGSGQAGNPHFTVDIQTGLQKALGWHPNADVEVKALQRGGMMPPYGGSFAQGGVVPGPIGTPRTIVAHGGESVGKPEIHIHFKPGTEWLRNFVQIEVDGAVNGQARLGNQLSRMSRA